MARGSKKKYTDKQKRQAEHIEEGYKERGTSEDEAERRAWATVNKSSGGGKKSSIGGSGFGHPTSALISEPTIACRLDFSLPRSRGRWRARSALLQ